jgi:hypothetical protein
MCFNLTWERCTVENPPSIWVEEMRSNSQLSPKSFGIIN